MCSGRRLTLACFVDKKAVIGSITTNFRASLNDRAAQPVNIAWYHERHRVAFVVHRLIHYMNQVAICARSVKPRHDSVGLVVLNTNEHYACWFRFVARQWFVVDSR